MLSHLEVLEYQILNGISTSHPSFFGGVKFKLDDHERTRWGVIVGALGTPKQPRNKSFMEKFFTSGFCWQPRGSNLDEAGPFDLKADDLSAIVIKTSRAKNSNI